MARSKRGRPRKAGERHPGGKLSQSPGPTPEMIARREELAGAGNGMHERAGTIIGCLWLRGLLGPRDIAERRYQAGMRLAADWRRYEVMIEAPPRTPLSRDGVGPRPDVDPEQYERAKRAFDGAIKAAESAGSKTHVWEWLEGVLMDSMITEFRGPRPSPVLVAALDALADYYGLDKMTG